MADLHNRASSHLIMLSDPRCCRASLSGVCIPAQPSPASSSLLAGLVLFHFRAPGYGSCCGRNVRAKRKRQEASSAEAEECFEVWRQTRSEKSKTQEQANMARWFNAPSLLPNSKDTKLQRSLEELGDMGMLEEYYRQEFAEEHKQLEKSFFQCDAVTLARRLLGKFLYTTQCVILRITEAEAYQEGDSAFKFRFGGRDRTPELYESGGLLFERDMGNGRPAPLYVVADKEGVGAGVLALQSQVLLIHHGLSVVQIRRENSSTKPVLLNGPEKVAQVLRLMFSTELYEPHTMELLDGAQPEAVLVGPRICGKHANPQDLSKPWRFAIAGTPWVSKPRDTLVPLT